MGGSEEVAAIRQRHAMALEGLGTGCRRVNNRRVDVLSRPCDGVHVSEDVVAFVDVVGEGFGDFHALDLVDVVPGGVGGVLAGEEVFQVEVHDEGGIVHDADFAAVDGAGTNVGVTYKGEGV